MKILYRQSSDAKREISGFSLCGINNCYFKSIKQNLGDCYSAKKRHSHNGFEFHIMFSGGQIYESDGGRYALEGGNILAVPKGVPHALVSNTYPMMKYAFTFSLRDGIFEAGKMDECFLFPIPDRVMSNILAADSLRGEGILKDILIENIVFETVCLLLREIGIAPEATPLPDKDTADDGSIDERVELAVQFIRDNVYSPLRVGEVAAYCYISEKQLNRLFVDDLGISVSDFIRRERLLCIESLLSGTRLSLTQISDRFGFPTEHGFNVFFKKYNGMPPGEYRKMNGRG